MQIDELLTRVAGSGEPVPWEIRRAEPLPREALREAARTGAPELRRAALEVLVTLDGPRGLEASDLTLIRRWSHGELPRPMSACEFWYALPTGDTTAILEEFGFSGAIPVTMRMGVSAWRYNWTGVGRHFRCRSVYVSPVLNGWTLVFGEPSADAHVTGPPVGPLRQVLADDAALTQARRDRCVELSRRFGAAHVYFRSHGDDQTFWGIAEQGELVRFYDVMAPDEQVGRRHPAEEGFLLPHERRYPAGAFDDIEMGEDPSEWQRRWLDRAHQLDAELKIPPTCDAETIARCLSVDPNRLGPAVAVSGQGLLALTGCGRA